MANLQAADLCRQISEALMPVLGQFSVRAVSNPLPNPVQLPVDDTGDVLPPPAPPLPSRFCGVRVPRPPDNPRPAQGSRRRQGTSSSSSSRSSSRSRKVKMMQKSIVCLALPEISTLPLAIPRKDVRGELERAGLIQEVCFTNLESPASLYKLIGDTFRGLFDLDLDEPLQFQYMCVAKGCKRLEVPVVSPSFEWTPEAVARQSGQGSLYILPYPHQRLLNRTPSQAQEPTTISDEELPDIETPSQAQEPTTISDEELPDIEVPIRRTNRTVAQGTGRLRPHTGPPPPNEPWILDSLLSRPLPEWILSEEEQPVEPETEPEDIAVNAAVQVTAETMQEYLQKLIVENNKLQTITLRQRHVWADMSRWLQRKNATLTIPTRIAFLGQTGVDDKGLTRQTATYIIQGLCHTPVFVGAVGRLTLTSDPGLLVAKEGQCQCQVAGRMVGFVLTHAGLPVNLFAPSLVFHLSDDPTPPKLEDVPEREFRDLIQKVKEQEGASFPSEEAVELAQAIGYNGLLTPASKEVLLTASISHKTVVANRAQIQAFSKGLDETGVLSLLRGQAGAAIQLLCGVGCTPLTAQALFDFFVKDLAPDGSNQREAEESILMELLEFLAKCENGESSCTLQDILEFCSGARAIPPGGLGGCNSVPTIHFKSSGLPTSSTCAVTLTLPRHIPDDRSFQEIMEMAVQGSPCFDD